MNKIKNKIIALLVVFMSIISFFPVGFSGQVANAAEDPTAVKVYINNNKDQLIPRTDTAAKEEIYSTEVMQSTFDITLEDLRIAQTPELSQNELIKNVTLGGKSASGIVDQKIEILSINKMKCETQAERDLLESQLGIEIIPSTNPNMSTKRIGERILGLPLGVNKIEYRVTITTQTVDYVPAVKDVSDATYIVNAKTSKMYEDNLTIDHGTKYVTSKISPMIFNAYIGDKSKIGNPLYDENNMEPFKYSTTATPDSNMPLRYTFDVPDSTSILEYNMTFGALLGTNTQVYKNGTKAETELVVDTVAGTSTLTGNLERLGQSDIIVVKLDTSDGSNYVQKVYSIEIRYNNLDASEDYSLRNPGITKLNFNDDSSVKAYVGKTFKVDNTNTFPTYKGEIYIDKNATKISIDPNLIRSKSTVAYVVTNNYVDSSGITQVEQSGLEKGKQYINFMAGQGKNELQVDVYEGTNGNITNGSKILARYKFNVNLLTVDTFEMALTFDNYTGSSISEAPLLTQPGVKGNEISFSTDRRTYDLYEYGPDSNEVKVTLDGAIGHRTYKNEYIKVWLADDINSNNLSEAAESKNNNIINYNDENQPNYLEKESSLDIDFGESKKMVVQAYYDQFEYDINGIIKVDSSGMPIYSSYPIGDKYVFYLPDNFGDSETPNPGEKSDNASLSLLKIADGTLKDSDGNNGFSSDKFDYTVVVPKENTSAKITATAEDDNIKSIVATIDGHEEAYELVSGKSNELPLNSSGKTSIKIVVTAQDGVTMKTYTVTIQNNTKGGSANLKNVVLNTGDYTFDPTEDVTKVRVDQTTTSIKITPLPEDPKATVTVNGEDFVESPITIGLKGTQKTEVDIVVRSEDGSVSKTYTLEIYRVDSADWDNNGDNGDDSSEEDQFYDEFNECWVDLTKYDQWGSINGKPAYFDKKSRQVKNAWITTGGKNYYLNNTGYRASGWKVDDKDGKTYYLDSTTGEMRKEWMNLNNSWYYLGLNGVMHKGWLYANGKWYYFSPSGQMVINQSMYIDGQTYNFGQDGAIY